MGSLRYLTFMRPDLAFSIGYVSKFMQQLMTEHLQAIKRIIRYVASTLDYGLHYPRCPNAARVHQTGGNRSGLTGYRSNRSGLVPVWTGTKPIQIQNSNLNSKK